MNHNLADVCGVILQLHKIRVTTVSLGCSLPLYSVTGKNIILHWASIWMLIHLLFDHEIIKTFLIISGAMKKQHVAGSVVSHTHSGWVSMVLGHIRSSSCLERLHRAVQCTETWHQIFRWRPRCCSPTRCFCLLSLSFSLFLSFFQTSIQTERSVCHCVCCREMTKVCKSVLNWMTVSLKRYETTKKQLKMDGCKWTLVSDGLTSAQQLTLLPGSEISVLLQVSPSALSKINQDGESASVM